MEVGAEKRKAAQKETKMKRHLRNEDHWWHQSRGRRRRSQSVTGKRSESFARVLNVTLLLLLFEEVLEAKSARAHVLHKQFCSMNLAKA
jgi:hypothetical protein